MPISFRETRAWVSLVTTLGVWGWYAARLWGHIVARDLPQADLLRLFATCAGTLIALQIVLGILAAILHPKQAREPADERERQVELKATRVAFFVLSIGCLTVALATPLVPGIAEGLFHSAGATMTLMANGIFLAVVLAEIVKSGAQVVSFRRGA